MKHENAFSLIEVLIAIALVALAIVADDSPFSPPINSNGEVLNDFAAFSQQVTVENVSASDFEQADPNSDFVRVTVKVFLNSKQVSTASWIRAQY
jgi:prepilin-type N-terminal cleavage/methylation domain-containing protein